MPSAAAPAQATATLRPDFVRKIDEDYASKVAHVFVVHGNINDYCDNSGQRQSIAKSMALCWDNFVIKEFKGDDKSIDDRGLQATSNNRLKMTRIMATFNLSTGLEFAHESSKKVWKDAMTAAFPEEIKNWPNDWDSPSGIGEAVWVLQKWFTASKQMQYQNADRISNGQPPNTEILLSVLFTDSDALFPEGQIAALYADRPPIVCVRAWARDEYLGNRNRIVLLTRHLTDVHDSLRGGGSGISTVLVPKPSIDDRKTWLTNFSQTIERRVKEKGALGIGANKVHKVNMAEGFDELQFAVQSAGMSRRQMEDVIMQSWLTNEAVDYRLVRERKQKALEDEYQGIVDFYEPEHGFEHIGGHEHLKKYFQRKVILPLRSGDTRTCTKGMLMTGPPGTGKTAIAKALAKEAKMNFMLVHLDKVFGGIVGETEKNMRKLIEAISSAAPVIVFVDELDSVLSSGRTSSGDSGTSGRVFNSFMTFMSDESRAGRVVVIAASNRPDLLDAALIRSGRLDAKIPALPPAKGDAKGRMSILVALCTKHDIKFTMEVGKTEKTPDSGLGRLLYDNERIWTGAEIEVVLKEAIDNAIFAGRKKTGGDPDYRMTTADWNQAMDDIIPNTEEVERMTKLSLIYVDNLAYCPDAYRSLAMDKAALREELGLRSRGED